MLLNISSVKALNFAVYPDHNLKTICLITDILKMCNYVGLCLTKYIFSQSHKVEMEVWKKSRKRKGVYVSPLVMDLSFKVIINNLKNVFYYKGPFVQHKVSVDV